MYDDDISISIFHKKSACVNGAYYTVSTRGMIVEKNYLLRACLLHPYNASFSLRTTSKNRTKKLFVENLHAPSPAPLVVNLQWQRVHSGHHMVHLGGQVFPPPQLSTLTKAMRKGIQGNKIGGTESSGEKFSAREGFALTYSSIFHIFYLFSVNILFHT